MAHRTTIRGMATALLLLTVSAAVAQPAAHRENKANFDRANRSSDQFLLRTSDIDAVAAEFGVTPVRRHDSAAGEVWLVKAPKGQDSQTTLHQILDAKAAEGGETVSLASLPALALDEGQSGELDEELDFSGSLNRPCLNAYMPGVWSGFTGQAADQMMQIEEAQLYGGCGEGIVVAVIDTAIDTTHPHLQGAVVDGYDFLHEGTLSPGSGHHADLDVRTLAILESSETALLAGSHHIVPLGNKVVLLGSMDTDAEIDLERLPAYYGHGTMTAGLIRLVAPGAKIMPLVAFDDEGTGHPYDLIRAIYYAVDHGAHVINMSFSMVDYSEELGVALEYARHHGVVPVAATGNQGEHRYIFPASFTSTVGVASTNWSDHLTDFTNYGVPTADLTAPGEELVTLFPGGGFAVGWGTSFSTPLVAGTAALIHDKYQGTGPNVHRKARLDLLYGTIYREHLWDFVYSGGRGNAFGPVLYALGYL